MIPNDALINALRSLNYRYKGQTDRVLLYKQSGSTRRVMVRRNASHDETYVRTLLKQAGMKPDDIERFMTAARQ